ncbi:serine/threonine-protein kinase [Kamptonema sp. UHCC 0994]|uniref:serine/threonine protein kinase n=1 Tax=Kamptonema sp. UHCC 0994 TaxID=3031329 RepID=UPI0023BA31F7|nr:serine/threonine-protein kinase [Kamptonema sp. UHCC 0994]MDF0551827.1 serine/threonine-protein kinase [Kamptonema sp. UHCC 0994]
MNTLSPTAKPRSRYQAIRELGRNPEAGRITYLAKDNLTQNPVTIKQFIFAKPDSEWAGFKAYQSEIEILQKLSHPSIPCCLNSFQIPNGVALVWEYKEAKSLGETRIWNPEEIKQLTVFLLEILIYLQTQTPPVIHRNIKPENILIDEDFKVYLVDFSLPNIQGTQTVINNAAAGTVGFMPHEQLRNNELTGATDLYSIGATLACLLSQRPSSQIKTLFDTQGRINFQNLVSKQISFSFIQWLEKMMEAYPIQRYPSAAAALEALNKIEIERLPEVRINPDSLEFKPTEYGEIIAQSITVSNSIPDTILKGGWEVAYHPKEPNRRSGYKPWITFEPKQFEGNRVKCEVIVDTSQLLADKTYERQILLNAIASSPTHSVTIKVKTPKLAPNLLPKRSLAVLFIVTLAVGFLESLIVGQQEEGLIELMAWIGIILGTGTGFLGGLAGAFGSIPILGSTVSTAVVYQYRFGYKSSLGFVFGFIIGATTGYIVRHNLGKSLSGNLSGFRAGMYSTGGLISCLIAAFSFTMGIAIQYRFMNLFVMLALGLTGLPLGYLIFSQYQILTNYRKAVKHLIKP